MRLERASGILAHPTSFPGPHGVGDMGAGAYEFVDWLALGGQRYWQLMPLSPVGYGDSPYSTLSAFAGNPLLISIDGLVVPRSGARRGLAWLQRIRGRLTPRPERTRTQPCVARSTRSESVDRRSCETQLSEFANRAGIVVA